MGRVQAGRLIAAAFVLLAQVVIFGLPHAKHVAAQSSSSSRLRCRTDTSSASNRAPVFEPHQSHQPTMPGPASRSIRSMTTSSVDSPANYRCRRCEACVRSRTCSMSSPTASRTLRHRRCRRESAGSMPISTRRRPAMVAGVGRCRHRRARHRHLQAPDLERGRWQGLHPIVA